MPDHYQRIKGEYENLQGDSVALFRVILSAADEIGIDAALATLERCVIEKRTVWLRANLGETRAVGDPVMDGFVWFYERYLGLSIPEDGEIVENTQGRVLMRWWNPCPTLEACRQLGLDTRVVCRKAYHRPVQEFLAQIHPALRFDRNYACLRPQAAWCEEMISLAKPGA